MRWVEVPYEQLSAEALRGLVEEFVTRDGTDYGERETSLEDRCAAVVRQLAAREVAVVFDQATQSATLLTKDQLRARALET